MGQVARLGQTCWVRTKLLVKNSRKVKGHDLRHMDQSAAYP